jgi:hypothetical protein
VCSRSLRCLLSHFHAYCLDLDFPDYGIGVIGMVFAFLMPFLLFLRKMAAFSAAVINFIVSAGRSIAQPLSRLSSGP